jgi:peroxiredoxin
MNSRRSFIKRAAFMAVVMVLAAAAGSAGVLLWRTFNPPPLELAPSLPPSTPVTPARLAIGDHRPEFSLADSTGVKRSVTEWDGKLLILNFWATWCPPCLEEIPAFVRLQSEFGSQGVQFLGVALDSQENVSDFLREHSVNYPSFHGQRDSIEVGKRYGNSIGALPYTVVISRDGTVLATIHGLFDESAARTLIENNR